MKNYVSFKADFPKDTMPTEPPGRALAGLIRDALGHAGVHANSPSNRDDYAWEFDCEVGPRRFLILVGICDDGDREWLVFSESLLGSLKRLFGCRDAEEHHELNRRIHGVLKADPRFELIRWYTSDDWNREPDTRWTETPA
jgi:hypothetical protein